MRLSALLVKLIIKQEMNLEPTEINFDVKQTRMQIDEDIEKMQKTKLEQLLLEAPEVLKSAMKNTVEKGVFKLGHSDTFVRSQHSFTQG